MTLKIYAEICNLDPKYYEETEPIRTAFNEKIMQAGDEYEKELAELKRRLHRKFRNTEEYTKIRRKCLVKALEAWAEYLEAIIPFEKKRLERFAEIYQDTEKKAEAEKEILDRIEESKNMIQILRKRIEMLNTTSDEIEDREEPDPDIYWNEI